MSPGPQLSSAEGPFLPLAFRLVASLGLLIIQLAIDPPDSGPYPGEKYYFLALLAFLAEAIYQAASRNQGSGTPFSTPSLPRIRIDILLSLLLVSLVVAYQGIHSERFWVLYLFPVLASAFYLRMMDIISIGILTSMAHIFMVAGFQRGWIPAFGASAADPTLEGRALGFVLAFSTLSTFGATLVVVLIRGRLEELHQSLQVSEATVDELAALQRRVVESLFSGLVTVDLNGRLTSSNPAAEHILQRNLRVGMPVEEVMPLTLTFLRSDKGDERFERSFEGRDGKPRVVGGSVMPLRDRNAAPISGYLILFQDLTELSALRERNKLNDRMATIGELAAGLAHELRTPLSSINGCVQILKKKETPLQLQERVTSILSRETERLNRIITNFLDLARQGSLDLQILPLENLLEEVRSSWETDPRCEGLNLQVAIPGRRWVMTEPLAFHQILTNLLSNARKAVADCPEPRIAILCRDHPGGLTLTVEDNGCGMNEDQIRRIYDPFQSGFLEGTGLGMGITFKLIQQLGWNLEVQSIAGRGTQAHIHIPMGMVLDSRPEDSSKAPSEGYTGLQVSPQDSP